MSKNLELSKGISNIPTVNERLGKIKNNLKKF